MLNNGCHIAAIQWLAQMGHVVHGCDGSMQVANAVPALPITCHSHGVDCIFVSVLVTAAAPSILRLETHLVEAIASQ